MSDQAKMGLTWASSQQQAKNATHDNHKREWVGLTEEETAAAWSQSKGDVLQRLKPFARAIESKLKEKNNG